MYWLGESRKLFDLNLTLNLNSSCFQFFEQEELALRNSIVFLESNALKLLTMEKDNLILLFLFLLPVSKNYIDIYNFQFYSFNRIDYQ